VKSNFKRDVSSWQNEAREQVSREIKHTESNKDRLEQINVELRNIKSKISEGSTVLCSVSSLQPAEQNLDAGRSTWGSAKHNDSELGVNVMCDNIDQGDSVNHCTPSCSPRPQQAQLNRHEPGNMNPNAPAFMKEGSNISRPNNISDRGCYGRFGCLILPLNDENILTVNLRRLKVR
jgi:hypothetical protein